MDPILNLQAQAWNNHGFDFFMSPRWPPVANDRKPFHTLPPVDKCWIDPINSCFESIVENLFSRVLTIEPSHGLTHPVRWTSDVKELSGWFHMQKLSVLSSCRSSSGTAYRCISPISAWVWDGLRNAEPSRKGFVWTCTQQKPQFLQLYIYI